MRCLRWRMIVIAHRCEGTVVLVGGRWGKVLGRDARRAEAQFHWRHTPKAEPSVVVVVVAAPPKPLLDRFSINPRRHVHYLWIRRHEMFTVRVWFDCCSPSFFLSFNSPFTPLLLSSSTSSRHTPSPSQLGDFRSVSFPSSPDVCPPPIFISCSVSSFVRPSSPRLLV